MNLGKINNKNIVKESLLFSLKNTKAKRVDFTHHKHKEEVVVEPPKNVPKINKKVKSPKIKKIVDVVKEPEMVDVIKEIKAVDIIKETVIKKEFSEEVIQAKEDLSNLKKTFAKLLLPNKWSRKSVSVDSEE